MNDSQQFDDRKVAVITGVTSGIGQAIRQRLLAQNWRVIGVSRHLPLDTEGFEADLSVLEMVEPLCERILGSTARIDAFIHVAGVWHDEHRSLNGLRIDEFTTSQIINTMNVGVTSAMILSARLAHKIIDNGHVILLSGTFADGGANWLPYYTSKRALEDFMVGLASDVPRLKVHALSPSDTATQAYGTYTQNASEYAQSPDSVASACLDILDEKLGASSGTVVSVTAGKVSLGFHK